MRRRLTVALLTLLLLAVVAGTLPPPTTCPDLPLAALLLTPDDLPDQLKSESNWKVIVPEYQVAQPRGLAPQENLGRSWTEDSEVRFSPPQLTQHVSRYPSPWRAWAQAQLLRATSSRPRIPLEEAFPRQESLERLPSSAYVECEQGDEEWCHRPVYHARHGQYLLRIELMWADAGVHPQIFGELVLLFEDGFSARLNGCQ